MLDKVVAKWYTMQNGRKGGKNGMIAPNKKRIQVTVEVETLEQAKSNAKALGMSLSGYVNTVLKAVGTENMQEAFDVVIAEVVRSVAKARAENG